MRIENGIVYIKFLLIYGEEGEETEEFIEISEGLIGRSENVGAALRYFVPAPYKHGFDWVEIFD